MRETEILRGLHKARFAMRQNNKKFADGMLPGLAPATTQAAQPLEFADGMVPAKPVSAFSLKGMYNNAVAGTSNLMEKAMASKPKPQAPVAATPQPAAPAPATDLVSGARQGLAGGQSVLQRREAAAGLSNGTAFLEGPGTGKSDSIHGVSLSRGEAVLPAKTVQAVGVGNLARLIQDTNDGIPPKGLRAGGKYSGGTIGGVQVPSADDLDLKRVQPAATMPPKPAVAPVAPVAAAAVASPGVLPEAQAMKDAATARLAAAPRPPIATTAAATPASLAQPPAPQGFRAQAADMLSKAKNFATPGSAAKSTLSNAVGTGKDIVKTGVAGVGAGYAARAMKDIGNPVRSPDAPGLDSATQALVAQIPTGGNGGGPTPSNTPYNFFTDHEAGRNIHNAANAIAPMLGGGGLSLASKYAPAVVGGFAAGAQSTKIPTAPTTAGVTEKSAPAAPPAAESTSVLGAEQKPAGLAAVQRYDIPGKSPLFTNLTGAAGAADNAALMGRGQVSAQNMAAADNLEAKGMRERAAEQRIGAREQEAAQSNSPRALLMSQVQRGLAAGGQLTRAGAAALQGMDSTDATRQGHAMGLQSAMYGHDISKYGHDVTLANNQNRLSLDRSRLSHEMGQAAMKGVTDDNENSALVTSVDKDGKSYKDVGKVNALNQYMNAIAAQTTDAAGKPVNLEALRAGDHTKYKEMRSAAEAHMDLGNMFNDYSKDKTFGQATGWAPPNISAVREMSASDWFNGAGLTDAVLAKAKPGYYSKGVEIDLGGRKQIVPIGKLLESKYGGEHRKTINKWLKANKQPVLGNMATGE